MKSEIRKEYNRLFSPRMVGMGSLQNLRSAIHHTIIDHKCSWCNQPDFNFKDDLSSKEYQISALCQKCQDKTFREEN